MNALYGGEQPQTRSMERARDELVDKLEALALNDPRRGELARMIRQLDDEIDARKPL